MVYMNMYIGLFSQGEEIRVEGLVVLPVILVAHLLLFLACQWSVAVRCFVSYEGVKDVRRAETARVIPRRNAGQETLVPLRRRRVQRDDVKYQAINTPLECAVATFTFQEITYAWYGTPKAAEEGNQRETTGFQREEYPTEATFAELLRWKGYTDDEQMSIAYEKWGFNTMDIPVPSFWDLFKEHMVAPFFVFQVFCVLLWSLDEYWYYSISTLVLLVVFEGTVCTQRQRSLELLRRLRRPPTGISVYRSQTWQTISTEALLPGDICSIALPKAKRSRNKTTFPASSSEDHVESFVIPCDMALLSGSCLLNEAMLTGESTPQRKEGICHFVESPEDAERTSLQLKGDNAALSPAAKRHVLFGGTTLLQNARSSGSGQSEDGTRWKMDIKSPPDKGCLAVVLRTGFATSQGQLMRTILYTSGKVMAGGDRETGLFILVLVVFALISSMEVLRHGWNERHRNRFKLILHCIMIVTSVVPPELPMELSLAVTNSLHALVRELIYCTEPFRIPFGGKINACCFDKTGTLTSDIFLVRGIATRHGDETILSDASQLEDANGPCGHHAGELVLAACHSLVRMDSGELKGDSMELAAFHTCGWTFKSDGLVVHMGKARGPWKKIRTVATMPFESALRRMSVVGMLECGVGNDSPRQAVVVLTKGAPETIQVLLSEEDAAFHDWYTHSYLHWMGRGCRVLAMAYRVLGDSETSVSKRYPGNLARQRSEVEKDLRFCGFLVLDSPLKPNVEHVMRQLRVSGHRNVMITGDSALTALNVARQLGMVSGGDDDDDDDDDRHTTNGRGGLDAMKVLILLHEERGPVWRRASSLLHHGEKQEDRDEGIPFSVEPHEMHRLAESYCLCLTGEALDDIERMIVERRCRSSVLDTLCVVSTVYARVSPKQKERIILCLRSAGQITLMCGDGTNDVGALKQAHVGISVVNNPELENRVNAALASGGTWGDTGVHQNSQTRLLMELQQQEMDPTIVSLGDASLASPFTTRRTTLDSVLYIVKQGRCTLVTTMQVYKILALNCLITAYMMSTLYLNGLKQGDVQMTVVGIVIAGLFFCTSRSEPYRILARKRPPSSIFSPPVLLSIVLEFAVHFACMKYTTHLCQRSAYSAEAAILLDSDFVPNVFNTAIYLVSLVMQVNTFTMNYAGRPYMQDLVENPPLLYMSSLVYFVMVLLISQLFMPLNHMMKLVPLPLEVQKPLAAIMAADTVLTFIIERMIRTVL